MTDESALEASRTREAYEAYPWLKLYPGFIELPYPWCLDGQRACPPEDVGRVGDYQQFLEARRDRSHPEHREMRQWVGKHFKPELFSVHPTLFFEAMQSAGTTLSGDFYRCGPGPGNPCPRAPGGYGIWSVTLT